jgi:hypothetical protein
LDQRRFQDAVEKFDEAIRLEKKYANQDSDEGVPSEEGGDPAVRKKKAYVAFSHTSRFVLMHP